MAPKRARPPGPGDARPPISDVDEPLAKAAARAPTQAGDTASLDKPESASIYGDHSSAEPGAGTSTARRLQTTATPDLSLNASAFATFLAPTAAGVLPAYPPTFSSADVTVDSFGNTWVAALSGKYTSEQDCGGHSLYQRDIFILWGQPGDHSV